MKIIERPARDSWKELIKRPLFKDTGFETTVRELLNAVKTGGDQALKKLTLKYDGVDLSEIRVDKQEIEAASEKVSGDLKEALWVASKNIETFHLNQTVETFEIETVMGVKCWQKAVPIEKVGLYIPGGSAPLFSTVLMLGIPAKIAGCKEIVLCTPPDSQGNIHPAILYAAHFIGIDNIYRVGGVQAVAAMAYGTETIPRMDKIFGPGNQYVTKAKQLVNYEGVAIDMVAGPSEVMVIADETSNPSFVAADLLSQAEHGEDSMVVLVTNAESIIEKVMQEISSQIKALPRKAMAEKAIEKSIIVLIDDEMEIMDFANEYAPEHLIISTRNYEAMASMVLNAGSVFMGYYSPESAGDYASGTNHTLPTNGFAKTMGGVNMDSFVKKISFQELSRDGLEILSDTIDIMAEEEGLEAHRNAVRLRLKKE